MRFKVTHTLNNCLNKVLFCSQKPMEIRFRICVQKNLFEVKAYTLLMFLVFLYLHDFNAWIISDIFLLFFCLKIFFKHIFIVNNMWSLWVLTTFNKILFNSKKCLSFFRLSWNEFLNFIFNNNFVSFEKSCLQFLNSNQSNVEWFKKMF